MRRQLQSLLRRDKDSYKYNFGHVLVTGGSEGLSGAPYLAAQAALKIGAGLVTIGCPQYLAPIMEIKTIEVMTLSLPQTREHALRLDAVKPVLDFMGKRKVNVLAVGPGLSTEREAQKVCASLIAKSTQDIVVDADGLKCLKGNLKVLNKKRAHHIVLTPHLGEFSSMTGISVSDIKRDREKLAKKFTAEHDVVLVLKGHHTLVAYKNKIYKNTTGNSGLSKAGTGDVLTGFIAGILAQKKLPVFDACKLAVYLHGLTADILLRDKTRLCIMAGDLIEALPKALKYCVKQS